MATRQQQAEGDALRDSGSLRKNSVSSTQLIQDEQRRESRILKNTYNEFRLNQQQQQQAGAARKKHAELEQQLRTSRGRLGQLLILALFVIGLIVCVSSILCILLLPAFVSNQISKRLVLRNNSLLLERWSRPNVPMYFKVWVFEVKNARELLDTRGAKPQLEEVGPFVFDLRRQKDVISFAGDNLYYTEKKVYHFNRELSCCPINRTVTVPNIPLVAVVDRALSYNLPLVGRLIPRLINRAIQSLREQLFVRKQVGELLFDGYEVDLLKMVSRIGSLVGLPQQSQRFALLKGRNDTWRPEQDGVWAINTGARDRRQFGRVSSWNSYRQLPFWSGAQCNAINGSDGTLFPPPIRPSEPLYIFNQELCRTVNLVYDRPSDVRSISALRFVLNPLNFAHTVAPTPAASAPAASLLTKPATPPVNPLVISNGQSATPAVAAAANHRPRARHSDAKEESRGGQQTRRMRLRRASSSASNSATTGEQTSQSNLQNQEKFVQAAQQVQFDTEKQAEPSRRNPQTCFCDRKSTNLKGVSVCEFDGLIDLSKCSKQAQVIFGSMPHFNNGDPRLLRQVDGLQPNASRHTTYMDIEPNTGLVLGGKRRVQLNLLIKQNAQVEGFENINDMLVPIVWFEESAQIPEESARKFRSLYTDRIRLVNLTLISLLVASVVLLIIDARLLFTTHYWRQFKLSLVVAAAPTAPPASNGNPKATPPPPSDAPARRKRRLFRGPASPSAGDASPPTDNNQSSDETVSSSSAELHTKRQQQQQRQLARRLRDQASESLFRDEIDGNLTKRSDSPLLNSSTDDSECSPASSPELRKWAPPAATTNVESARAAVAEPNVDHVSNLLIVSGQQARRQQT